MAHPGLPGSDAAGRLSALMAALSDRYRLERELGAGGMATVYLAEDLKHHRQVAIKVLKPELAAVIGAARFLQEIRTIATLQHPHILGLIDSGDVEGTAYYVMPYVEGESLRDRLNREKQLPVADAVRLATEVASALDYAHRHGVIHRDIKPENVLLHDGQALVADFGIALAVSSAGGARMTETGLSLGTPHYMSPEQAMGERDITPRSDVYALGAMAYEMLSGDPPFTGSTAQAIVAKVMSEEPTPLRRYRKAVPEPVDAAVLTALEKLPADRFGTAAEFSAALAGEATAARRLGGSAPRRLSGSAAMLGVTVLLVGGVGGWLIAARRPAPETGNFPPSRLAMLSTGLGGTGIASQYRQVALTPDGQAVVFVTLDLESVNALAIQRLDAAEPTIIEGGGGILSPRVTPDGRSVIGWAAGLYSGEQEHALRIPIGGGTAQLLPGDPQTNNMDWGTDGSIWYTPYLAPGIRRLSPDGTLGAVPGEEAGRLRMQQVLPDGKRAITLRASVGVSTGPLVLLDLESGAVAPLSDLPVVEARYVSGELLYVRPDGSMWAAPFDEDAGRIAGNAVQIASDVDVSALSLAQWAVAPTGTVAYVPATPLSLMLVSRDGSRRTAAPDRSSYHFPQFSPDGRQLTVDMTSAEAREVWLLSLSQRTLTRVTFTGDGHDATWTPDGQAITFTSFDSSTAAIWQVRPGDGVAAESLFASPKLSFTGFWKPDGSGLITVATDLAPGSGVDLAVVEGAGRGPLEPVIVNEFETQYPALSPDGHWLAYVSQQSGIQQVHVRALEGGAETQVSREGGTEPVWRDNGRELFFIAPSEGGKVMMAASVGTEPGFEVLERQVLFDATGFLGANPHQNYDVSPDGQTFAMVHRNPANRIVILQNVGELVRRIRGE